MPDGTFHRPRPMRDVPEKMADRLIVALDVPSVIEAERLIDKLDGVVSFYKIGLWLLFADGSDKLIDSLIAKGKNVFLDYKMFDIGETVRRGVERAVARRIKFITVHGDKEIMEAAVGGRGANDFTKIFAITVLTSLNDEAVQQMGYRLNVKELIDLRVRSAMACGCDGIIASADDNPNDIRSKLDTPKLLIATPGIRPAGANVDDHKRFTTPAEAIQRGADYLIMGRPILEEADPRAAAQRIIAEMESAT